MSITETPEAPGPDIPAGDTSIAEPVEAAPQEPTEVTEGERYTVTIDGRTEEVTLDELRSGYSRQQDYTKKTQELAEARKRLSAADALATALDKDPINTLKTLNEAYQLNDVETSAEWDEMDPQEQRIARLEHELSQQRARDARSTIETEFKNLESVYGEIERQDVATYAMRHDLTVTDAYRVMNFDSLRDEKLRLAEEAKVVDSKRNGVLPGPTGGTQRGAIAPANQGKKMGVRESYLAALKQAQGD